MSDDNIINNFFNGLNLNDPDGYIPDHESKSFARNYNALNYLKINKCISVNEIVELELNMETLDKRLYRDPNNRNHGTKEYYYNLKNYCHNADGIYDIEVRGNIYKISVLSDNNTLMEIVNEQNNNRYIKIPIFDQKKPLPIFGIKSKLYLAIEMNQKYNPKFDKICIKYKSAHYKDKYKCCIDRSTIKINLLDNTKICVSSGRIRRLGQDIPTFII
jgi:hypothetical protein